MIIQIFINECIINNTKSKEAMKSFHKLKKYYYINSSAFNIVMLIEGCIINNLQTNFSFIEISNLANKIEKNINNDENFKFKYNNKINVKEKIDILHVVIKICFIIYEKELFYEYLMDNSVNLIDLTKSDYFMGKYLF